MTSQAQPQIQPQVKKKDRSTTVLLLMAAVVAVAGVAFAIGRLTAPAGAAAVSNNSAFRGFARASGAPGGNGAGAFRGGLSGGIEGTVESIDGSTMTVKLASGTTVTVDLGTGTTYHTETSATASQVTTGSKVLVTIDTSNLGTGAGNGGTQPNPAASGAPGGFNRTFTAKDVIVMP